MRQLELEDMPLPACRWAKIDIPPSANHCHAHGGKKRFRNAKYQHWLDTNKPRICDAMTALRASEYPVSIRVIVHGGKGWRTNRDIDNVIKPTIDLLRHAGILVEDNTAFVCEVSARFEPPQSKKCIASCVVEIYHSEVA